MGSSVHYIKQACVRLGIPYEEIDQHEALLKISLGKHIHYIVNTNLGLNNDALGRLSRDKFYHYLVLSNSVSMPYTKSYIDPEAVDLMRQFSKLTFGQIIADITVSFELPVIVKRNSGTQGENVFLCTTVEEVTEALQLIFSKKQLEYDHVALVQTYIKPHSEYRAACLHDQVEFIYLKDNSSAIFEGNLSPLHWKYATTKLVDRNEHTYSEIQRIYIAIRNSLPIEYGGLDVIEDEQGKLWLIEINAAPGYGEFIKHSDPEILVNFYAKVLQRLVCLYEHQ
jgi:glutathione synthase/RimK-type ligase-like ATP-grasp enzyme